MEMSFIAPWLHDALPILLLVTDMPEMEPVETVPPLSPITTLDKDPEPVLLSSGASTEPSLVPMEMWFIIRLPSSKINTAFEVTDMPEKEPVETVPPLSPITTCDKDPEPVLLSSGACTEPSLVPMEMSFIVPWPAAMMVPELEFTDLPYTALFRSVPPLSPITTCDKDPEPVLLSSGASTEPSLVPM